MAGIDGLVPVGTTGESPTLSAAERDRCIEIAVEAVAARPERERVPVIAGTGSNDTRGSIEATRRAAALGADAALIVTPYYNKPDQRMLEAHFRAVADEGGLPIIVYNVPGRTGANVEADTFLRLAEHPRVIAVKEASANIEQIAVICRDRPRDVAVLSGDDAATLAVLAMGGDGVDLRREQRDPGRDGRARRRVARRRPDRRPPDPRPVPAAAARQLPGRPEPGARRRPPCWRWACSTTTPCASRSCRWTRAPRERLVALLRSLGLVAGGGRQALLAEEVAA